MTVITPPHTHIYSAQDAGDEQNNLLKGRNSNLELYRIIVMILIVMHHYVVNSGVIQEVRNEPFAGNSIFMTIFGLWGKTGINCFVMITGWFMCTSHISIKKFLKLVFQVEFYCLVFDAIFVFSGYEHFSLKTIRHIFPLWSIGNGFTGAFIYFYLLIPFLNLLIHNLTKSQHAILTMMLLSMYTLLTSSGMYSVVFNYITWFSVLFILMSYIRKYGFPITITHRQWGYLSLLMIFISLLSVFIIQYVSVVVDKSLPSWYFVSDSNKIFALLTALCSFMWFKDLNIKYNKFINIVGSSTFGVLLIHANSDTMRQWLWRDTLQNAKVFYTNYYAIHAIISCLAIFAVCIFIDQLRIRYIEAPLFRWIDEKYGEKFKKIESIIF